MISRLRAPLAVILVAMALTLVAAPSPVSAAEPTVTDRGVQDNFPNGMTFTVHAESATQITGIRLLYKILPDGTSAIARPTFEPGATVDATVSLAGLDSPNLYLPPGTVIEYSWEATDDAGNVSETEKASFFYDDIRFEWRNVTGDDVTIFYYSGSDGDAQDMHDVALQAISDAEALLGATVPFGVQVWLYDNSDDMRPALQPTSPGFESQIITEGVRVSSNTVLVLGNASFDTLRHELTHVVTKQAGESALGRLPAWLDEGTAVHGQQDPGGYKDALDDAVDRGNVLSVREITSYPGDAQKINLFYGEAWSIVSYLVDTYGPEKYAQLYANIKAGKGVDKSFELVYGFDQDGLDNAWRVSKGLPERATPEPTTPRPFGTTIATSPATSSDSGTNTTTVIALAAGFIILAAVVGVGGVTIARRL